MYYRTCTNLRILYIFVHTTTISYRTCPHCYLLFILVCTPTISYRTCTHFYILYVYVQKTMCSIYNLYIPTHMTLLCTAYKRYSFKNLYQPLYIHEQYPYYTKYLRTLLYTVHFAPYIYNYTTLLYSMHLYTNPKLDQPQLYPIEPAHHTFCAICTYTTKNLYTLLSSVRLCTKNSV